MSYFLLCSSLQRLDLLLSYPTATLASHITNILIKKHKSLNFNHTLSNEDTQTYIRDPAASSALVGASSYERDRSANITTLMANDAQRHPLGDDDLKAMLTRGRHFDEDTCCKLPEFRALVQILPIISKRIAQFRRSKGQWMFSFFIPLAISFLMVICIDKIPLNVLGNEQTIIDTTACYTQYTGVQTFVGAADGAAPAVSYAAQAGLGTVNYSGNSYEQMYDSITKDPFRNTPQVSSDAIFYENISNYTLMYNASYPMNLACAYNQINNAIVKNATGLTGTAISSKTGFSTFPNFLGNAQLNWGGLFVVLMGLWAGSMGGGLSIVLSQEKVLLVKHQQLTSGASALAYWIANFVFDLFVFLVQLVALVSMIVFSGAPRFQHVGEIEALLLVGCYFCVVAVLRCHAASFFISDIKTAQSVFFWGVVLLCFILNVMFLSISFGVNKSVTLSTPASILMLSVFSFVEPAFGFGYLVLMQNDYLGCRSLDSSADNKGILTIGGGPFVAFAAVLLISILTVFYLEKGRQWFKATSALCCDCFHCRGMGIAVK